jgi:hypothetical protein
MNEFRTQLTKQATEFATKVQVEADRDRLSEVTAEKEKALEQRLDAREARLVVIERFKANWEGRFWMLVFLIGAVEVAMRVFWK